MWEVEKRVFSGGSGAKWGAGQLLVFSWWQKTDPKPTPKRPPNDPKTTPKRPPNDPQTTLKRPRNDPVLTLEWEGAPRHEGTK